MQHHVGEVGGEAPELGLRGEVLRFGFGEEAGEEVCDGLAAGDDGVAEAFAC